MLSKKFDLKFSKYNVLNKGSKLNASDHFGIISDQPMKK